MRLGVLDRGNGPSVTLEAPQAGKTVVALHSGPVVSPRPVIADSHGDLRFTLSAQPFRPKGGDQRLLGVALKDVAVVEQR